MVPASSFTEVERGLAPGRDSREARLQSLLTAVPSWVVDNNLHQLLQLTSPLPFSTRPDWKWLSGSDTAVPTEDDRRRLPHVLDAVLEVEKAAAARFDFRGAQQSAERVAYLERDRAATGNFDAPTTAQVVDCASALGLVRPGQPRWERYDATVVLGGMRRSPLLRSKYAQEFAESGVDLGHVYWLGSPRPLIAGDPSRGVRAEQLDAPYAPGSTDEFDLMIHGAEATFGLRVRALEYLCGCVDPHRVCPAWSLRTAFTDAIDPLFTHERAARLVDQRGRERGTVLSASTGQPPNRPNTGDTFALLRRQAGLTAGQRMLIVTTQMFVPFQGFDALSRMYLPDGVDVDIVGYGADWGDRVESPENLLQETLSGIRSARRLLVAAARAASAVSSDEMGDVTRAHEELS